MDVSENSGTPKTSILIGFSSVNHPFWGTSIFGNTHMVPIFQLHYEAYVFQFDQQKTNDEGEILRSERG